MDISSVLEEQHLIELQDSKSFSSKKNKSKDLESYHNGTLDYISNFEAFASVAKLSIPSIVGLLLRRGVDLINQMYVGRLDNQDYIAGVGLAHISYNLLWISAAIGLAGGIETLSSHAFGSNNNYLAGWYYHRAIVIITVMFMIELLFLWNTESLLLLAGQPIESSKIAARYTRIFLPGIYAFCNIELLRRFLNVQGVYYLILKVQIFTIILHIGILYLFVIKFEYGVDGVAIAVNINSILLFSITAIYITLNPKSVRPGSWHWFNKDSFQGIPEYLRYGIPSTIMLLLESLTFQIYILISGRLGNNQQSASILFSILGSMLVMVPIGISIAASNLIGNNLGAGKPKIAKTFVNMALMYACLLGMIIVSIVYTFQNQIASVYTYHKEIKDLVSKLIPILWSLMIVDYAQWTAAGIIRAMGFQGFAVYGLLFSYWFIALPITVYATFYLEWDVVGVWIGLPFGMLLLLLSYLYIIYTADFNKLSVEISKRLRKDKDDLDNKEELISSD